LAVSSEDTGTTNESILGSSFLKSCKRLSGMTGKAGETSTWCERQCLQPML